MKRIHCKFCHAKPRVQYAVTYAGHEMCADCKWEYQAIFEGKVSKQFYDNNRSGPPVMPKQVQDYYNQLLLGDDGISEDS